MSAALALRRAVQARLAADAELTALVGGRIYDRVPDRARAPYVTHGEIETLPIDGEGAAEHLFALEVWSRARGGTEVLRILDRLARALRDVPASLAGHRLVSLRPISSAALPGTVSDAGGIHRGAATFRAVTEPEPEPS